MSSVRLGFFEAIFQPCSAVGLENLVFWKNIFKGCFQVFKKDFYRLAERGYEIACRLSVPPSVRDVEVCFSHRLEFFENNFTAE